MTEKDELLFQAICDGNLELCKERIAQGADVNAKNIYGHTVLSSSKWSGNQAIYNWLMEHRRERKIKGIIEIHDAFRLSSP